ncbi:hypothetical protein KGQ19_00855 [Catenulispora sp. NL8]|uniref:Uncharacterized protein n=1 Tax=Catenulispora pinistramenti TaxID=2705254 RepID=A0ABS5KGP2_9ACTN|nr:hypothetical protein [Catenulispora pinistramenti]MBS2545409.1 hypothetical protein [Catenulispora pinistramenti]
MSDSPQSRRRTSLWRSFMPDLDPEPADTMEARRAQADQTLLRHAPQSPNGLCECCREPWPCEAAGLAALVLELLG